MSLADDIKKAIKEQISPEAFRTKIKNALGKLSEDIVNDAKENLRQQKAINNGQLVNSIIALPVGDDLSVIIQAGASYAPYIEFGTRKFAAEYVAGLPKEWKDIASQYKGSTAGTFEQLVASIAQWVADKQIVGTYSVKTRKRTGSKESKEKENLKAAWPIAISIARNGIKARPYLYPAVQKNVNIFAKEIDKVFQ